MQLRSQDLTSSCGCASTVESVTTARRNGELLPASRTIPAIAPDGAVCAGARIIKALKNSRGTRNAELYMRSTPRDTSIIAARLAYIQILFSRAIKGQARRKRTGEGKTIG